MFQTGPRTHAEATAEGYELVRSNPLFEVWAKYLDPNDVSTLNLLLFGKGYDKPFEFLEVLKGSIMTFIVYDPPPIQTSRCMLPRKPMIHWHWRWSSAATQMTS